MNSSGKGLDRHLIIFCSLLGLLALAAGCASIGNPSGGPRDEQPPRFMHANPAPGTANVSNRIDRIRLDFDELVTLKDAFNKVVVSPPSASVPRVTSSGRSVFVNFQDSLEPNTTYTIDFSNSIEDNNENNPLENFSYTFSTGPVVDSLRIAGYVISADAMEPMQGKIVGVHRDLGDSAVYVRRFDRVAKTDDRGRFSIEGLAPGKYRVYAIDDTNTDFMYSSPDEEFAFSREIISPWAEESLAYDSIYNLKEEKLDTVIERRRTVYFPNNVMLRSFKTSRKQQFVGKYERIDSTRINIIFNAPMPVLPEVRIVGAPDLQDWATIERSGGNDTITYWLSRPSIIASDTLRLAFTYQKLDSLRQYVGMTDTLRFVTNRPRAKKVADKKPDDKNMAGTDDKKTSKKKKKEEGDTLAPPAPTLKVNFLATSPKDVNTPLFFETETPLARLDTTNFRLEMMMDTLWKQTSRIYPASILNIPDSLWQERLGANKAAELARDLSKVKNINQLPILSADTLNPRRFRIDFPWAYDTRYRIVADTLAMEGIYGLPSRPIEQDFKTRSEKEYCSITLRITDWPSELPAFVELLSGSDQPLRSAPVENGVARFPYLTPGKYYFRIVNDLNGNGLRDPGDIMENRLPEESYYYPKAINIKQNWNKDESWQVFATAIDEMKPRTLLKNRPARRKGEKDRQDTSDEDEDEEENLFPSAAERNRQQNRGGNAGRQLRPY